jgi:hypothetical protein
MTARAELREIDGQLVLDDPDALAMIRGVGKYNCRAMFESNAERVEHFKRRLIALGLSPSEFIIVLLNVDDRHGCAIADVLMPGHDWQSIRDQGQVPVARGLAKREPMRAIVESFDPEASEKMRGIDGVVTLVVDHGVAEVFAA